MSMQEDESFMEHMTTGFRDAFEAYQEEGLFRDHSNRRNIDAKVKLTWRAIADADRPLAVDMRRLAAKFGYVDEAPASAK